FGQGGRTTFPQRNREFFPGADRLNRRQKNRSHHFVASAEPFRFSTSDSADRDERKLGGAGHLRSFQFYRTPACGPALEKTSRMGARAARAASARDENSLWRWRGDVRRDSEDQGFHGRAGGRRHGD